MLFVYVVVRPADKADAAKKFGLVELNPQHQAKPVNRFLDAYAQKYGGVRADYKLFDLRAISGDAVAARVLNGDEFNLVWTGNNVSGVDFAPEDAKFLLDVTAPNLEVPADGATVVNVTVELFNANGTPRGNFSGSRELEISSPIGAVRHLLNFNAGVAVIPFRTQLAGYWQFPHNRKRLLLNGGGQVRVRKWVRIDALQVF